MLGKCCPSRRDSFWNLLVLVFVSDALDVVFNVLNLSVVDIHWCVVCPSSPLSSTCSSSDPDCHFHKLITVAFFVAHVVY